MYLIDTDVLSAMRREERNPAVAKWTLNQRTTDLYLSVVSIGEIERGIVRQRTRNPAFARALADWLDSVIVLYGERMLDINLATIRRWGRLCAELNHAGSDLLIAATALEHGLSVVTRNVRHFQPTGVKLIDPRVP